MAQLRYKPATTAWTLYWADRNSRWHLCDDLGPDQPVQALIDEINNDPTGIF